MCGLCTLLAASAASAQDAGNLGLTIAYPGRIGLLWHVSDRVAIRPAVSFTSAWGEDSISESQDFTATANDAKSVDFDISVLIGVAKWDDLRAYVVPRYAYNRTSSSFEVTATFVPGGSFESEGLVFENETTSHGFGAAVGLQHALHERFSVFAEAGLRYDHATTRFERANTAVQKAVSSSAFVGAVFYFRK